MGAVPEPQVRQWIGQVLAVAAKMGLNVTPPAGGPDDAAGAAGVAEELGEPGASGGDPYGADAGMPPAFLEARQAMERGDFDAAARAFETELANSPADPIAKTGLAQVNLIRRVNSYDEAKVRRDAAEHPADPDAQSKVADIDLASGLVDEAFDRLLGVVRRTSGEERNKARVHLVELFEILPPRDPRVTKARATLSALLF
jgi:putative thioredoxin